MRLSTRSKCLSPKQTEPCVCTHVNIWTSTPRGQRWELLTVMGWTPTWVSHVFSCPSREVSHQKDRHDHAHLESHWQRSGDMWILGGGPLASQSSWPLCQWKTISQKKKVGNILHSDRLDWALVSTHTYMHSAYTWPYAHTNIHSHNLKWPLILIRCTKYQEINAISGSTMLGVTDGSLSFSVSTLLSQSPGSVLTP